jgi:hypothetical protein
MVHASPPGIRIPAGNDVTFNNLTWMATTFLWQASPAIPQNSTFSTEAQTRSTTFPSGRMDTDL